MVLKLINSSLTDAVKLEDPPLAIEDTHDTFKHEAKHPRCPSELQNNPEEESCTCEHKKAQSLTMLSERMPGTSDILTTER